MSYSISVFTPTYNREQLLKRCYESLRKQTCKDFEWLVVDDGSTDGTKSFINSIKNKADFKIKYVYQKNGGKHRAFNRAVKECRRDYMLILDSDDVLTSDAIAVLKRKCCDIKDNEKVCGIIGNLGVIGKTEVMGTKMPDVKYASGLELYQKMGLHGDTMRLYKTSVLREYPFPEIDGENFMYENAFGRIDEKYKMLVIKEVLYLCEYQDSGLTRNIDKLKLKNPIGHSISLRVSAETALTIKKKIGMTIIYILWCRRFRIKHSFVNFRNKITYLLCWPVSFIFQILRRPKFYYAMFKKNENQPYQERI